MRRFRFHAPLASGGFQAAVGAFHVYLERAIHGLREAGQRIDNALLGHLSPLGWEYINLTGDYVWHGNKRVVRGAFRPLPRVQDAVSQLLTAQAEA
jgi:hypothetical protein